MERANGFSKKRDHQDEVSRLARQDLLRRRDLNSVMGLHPRIMSHGASSASSYALNTRQPMAGGKVVIPRLLIYELSALDSRFDICQNCDMSKFTTTRDKYSRGL